MGFNQNTVLNIFPHLKVFVKADGHPSIQPNRIMFGLFLICINGFID